jgi:hypothetical protein
MGAARFSAQLLVAAFAVVMAALCTLPGDDKAVDANAWPTMRSVDAGLPSRDIVAGFALLHAKRLGLLPYDLGEEEFRRSYPVSVRPWLCHAEGSWRVLITDVKREVTTKVVVTSRGTLVGFKMGGFETYDSDNDESGIPPEPLEEALKRARSFVTSIRGTFPTDVRLETRDRGLGRQSDAVQGQSSPEPYWVLQWQMYDGDVRYTHSYIKVVVAKTSGIVEYEDQYNPRRTSHTLTLTSKQAEKAAREYFEEEILPKFKGTERAWAVESSEHPFADVWQVPGYGGDFLTYTVAYWVNVPIPSNPENDHIGFINIDAETGETVQMGMGPRMYWSMEGPIHD